MTDRHHDVGGVVVVAPPRRGLRVAAFAVAVATLLAAGAVLGSEIGGSGSGVAPLPAPPPMATVFPDGVLDLTTVNEAIAGHYRHAADNTDVYDQVRCYCGCEAAFDHARLTDCFLRADGSWEAHGSGCAICIAEADAVREHLDAATPVPDIVDDIDDRFGATTPAA